MIYIYIFLFFIFLFGTYNSDIFCYLPLKTKGYRSAIRFDILDEERCSAILVDTPTTIDQNIREIVCGKSILSHVGPDNHVINIPCTFSSHYFKGS